MDKRFFIVLAVLVLGLGALFVFTKDNSNSNNASISNHIRDNVTDKLELLVYGDFQCSVCRPFYNIEKQVLDKYPGQITMIFRHYPIDSIHPNARAAARAAEAAGLQGKFFEMHDMLYENQDAWSSLSSPFSTFSQFAANLGLNLDQFKADFESQAVNDTINADKAEGNKNGVEGTPTYILDGEQLNNGEVSTVESFSAKVEAALQSISDNQN